MEKLVVNENKCIGCGMCVGQNSDYFDFNDEGKSFAKKNDVNPADKMDLLNIVEMCPTEAIVIEEEK